MSIRSTKYNKEFTAEEEEQIFDYMAEKNTRKYNILKAAEEFQELALILTQSVTKPGRINETQITNEIGDAIIRLKVLERKFPMEPVAERISNKLNQFQRFIETGKHKNI
jgi:hypothetical protein